MTLNDVRTPYQSPSNPALLPSRRSAIDAFVVMDIMREANAKEIEGRDIVHMEVGQPGTPAPRVVREAVKQAVDAGTLGYTDALGMPALRERISRHYRDRYSLAIDPGRIVVTTGSSAGFVLAFLALVNAGGTIAIPQPGYPCYRQIARLLGITPVYLPAREETGFMPSSGALKSALSAPGANAVLLASPANPTGSMLQPGDMARLIAAAEAAGAWFISDEIYHGLSYGRAEETALAYSENAVVINSFSKYFSMTGWRVGWMVVPASLVRTFERLAQNLYISAPAVSQVAAIAAFDATEELEEYKAVYARNRAMLLEELPKAGFNAIAPADGAFYLYCDVAHMTDDADAFVRRMLQEIGVAATPGVDFDEAEGNRFVRFSYAGRFERMRQASARLQGWKR